MAHPSRLILVLALALAACASPTGPKGAGGESSTSASGRSAAGAGGAAPNGPAAPAAPAAAGSTSGKGMRVAVPAGSAPKSADAQALEFIKAPAQPYALVRRAELGQPGDIALEPADVLPTWRVTLPGSEAELLIQRVRVTLRTEAVANPAAAYGLRQAGEDVDPETIDGDPAITDTDEDGVVNACDSDDDDDNDPDPTDEDDDDDFVDDVDEAKKWPAVACLGDKPITAPPPTPAPTPGPAEVDDPDDADESEGAEEGEEPEQLDDDDTPPVLITNVGATNPFDPAGTSLDDADGLPLLLAQPGEPMVFLFAPSELGWSASLAPGKEASLPLRLGEELLRKFVTANQEAARVSLTVEFLGAGEAPLKTKGGGEIRLLLGLKVL